jgi:predicted amidohydrolase YtcJ
MAFGEPRHTWTGFSARTSAPLIVALQRTARANSKQVELFADGAIISQLMQMKDGYLDGHKGEWLMTPQNLDERTKLYWDAGYQLHIRLNGDTGLENLPPYLERRMREHPRADHRMVIVHFANSTEEQIGRIARLGAIVSANPYCTVGFADKYGKAGLGQPHAATQPDGASRTRRHTILQETPER